MEPSWLSPGDPSLQGIDNQKEWLCDVILPGVKDGMKEAGLTEEPPIVLRTHATDLRLYMADCAEDYSRTSTPKKSSTANRSRPMSRAASGNNFISP